MSDYECRERIRHRLKYWLKQIICLFLGHSWYQPLSFIAYCERCLKTIEEGITPNFYSMLEIDEEDR